MDHKAPIQTALPYRIKLLAQAMERHFQSLLDPYGLTPLQWGVLCRLWAEDGLPTLQIARQMEQLAGTIGVTLELLEKQAYVSRQRDDLDRRIVRVWLTPRGRELHQALHPHAMRQMEEMLGILPSHDLDHLSSIVEKLLGHLRTPRNHTNNRG